MSKNKQKKDWLSELSDDVLERIVGKLDITNRMKIRKVSKKFRDYIDGRNTKYDRFEIQITKKWTMLRFDNIAVFYEEHESTFGGCQVQVGHADQQKSVLDQTKRISDNHYYEIALDDLAIALKNPKLEVNKFILSFDDTKISDWYIGFFKRFEKNDTHRSLYEDLFKLLKTISQNSLLHAKEVIITSFQIEQVPLIFSFFKPSTLEDIILETVKDCENDSEWNPIYETDQWKQARCVDIRKIGKVFNDPCRLQYLHHLAQFYIHLTHISPEDVIGLRDALSKSNTFEYCKLFIDEDFSNSEMGRVFGAVDTDRYIRKLVHREPILNSNEFLEFKFERGFIVIEKKRENSEKFEKKNPFLKLSDDVIGKIIDKLEIRNRLTMRKVCRKFRSVVDDRKIKFHKIVVTIANGNTIIVKFDDIKVYYYEKMSFFGCLVKYENNKKKIEKGKYQYFAFYDLASVLMNPNIEVTQLHVDFNWEADPFSEYFCKLLKYISPFPVKFVNIHAAKADDVSSILSSLKPGTLKRIEFKYKTMMGEPRRIFDLEQLKQAKTVVVGAVGIIYIPSNSLKYLSHCTRFNVCMDRISAEDLVQFRKDLSQSANFKYGEMTVRYKTTLTKMRRALGGGVTQLKISDSNSNEFLEIKFDEFKITFEKKH